MCSLDKVAQLIKLNKAFDLFQKTVSWYSKLNFPLSEMLHM